MHYVGICDDEEGITALLEMVTTDYFESRKIDCEIIITHDPYDFLKRGALCDLIIMDINLRCDVDGVETIREMRKVNKGAQVIFLTAYDHRIDALNTRCQYLFKPFDLGVYTSLLDDLIDCLPDETDRIRIETTEGFFAFNINSLYYFEKCDRYTNIKTASRTYKTKLPINQIEEMLKGYPVKCSHKSYLVNTNLIRTVSENEVLMANGDFIPLAARRVKEFKLIFNQ